jgi:DNA-binding GntR family transcriptional regulator
MPVDLSQVLEPPEKRALAEDVAARLREAILQGHFAPGERLREERLARALGVSRGPVREALGQLERQGLVVINRNRGAVVAQLSPEDLEELYTFRLAIEELALRRTVQFADEETIQRFEEIVAEMVEATERGLTEAEAAELDLALHDLIYTTARHRRLLETWSNMRPQIHVLLLSRNVAHEDFRDMLLSSHQDIVEAIRNRDEERAAELLREHLGGSYERVARSMQARDAAHAQLSEDRRGG